MTEKRTPETQQQRERGEREQFIAPDVNIYETKDGYLLEAEMPGVGKEGLDITLEGTELTLTGRRSDQPPQGADILFTESRPLNYRRVFELDPMVDTGKINAKIEQGVLTLTLPKAERVKPKRINIA